MVSRQEGGEAFEGQLWMVAVAFTLSQAFLAGLDEGEMQRTWGRRRVTPASVADCCLVSLSCAVGGFRRRGMTGATAGRNRSWTVGATGLRRTGLPAQILPRLSSIVGRGYDPEKAMASALSLPFLTPRIGPQDIMNRVWLLPDTADPSAPDLDTGRAISEPGRPVTAFAEQFLRFDHPRLSRRTAYRDGILNLAIDGHETRDLFLIQAQPVFEEFTLVGAPEFSGPLRNVVALERTGWEADSFSDSVEVLAARAILAGTGIETRDGSRSQVHQMTALHPDAVIYWAGNNDSPEAAYSGLVTQFKLTPFDERDFSAERHAKEVKDLQPIRKLFEADYPIFIEEDPFGRLPMSLGTKGLAEANKNFLTFTGAFGTVRKAMKELRTREGEKPDIVVLSLPRTTIIPLNLPLVNGATVRELLLAEEAKRMPAAVRGALPANPLPYRINLFGRDITEEFLELRLSDIRLDDFGKPQRDDRGNLVRWPAGSQVSIFTIAQALQHRFGEVARRHVSVFSVLLAGKIAALRKLMLRGEIRGIIDDSLFGPRQELEGNNYAFRHDQVLDPAEQAGIKERIKAFNVHLRDKATDDSGERLYLYFNEIAGDDENTDSDLDRASTPAGLEIGVEGFSQKVWAALRGGVFSFDGIHPGSLAHAHIALRLLRFMEREAAKRGRFGMVPHARLVRAIDPVNWRLRFESARRRDELIQSVGLPR